MGLIAVPGVTVGLTAPGVAVAAAGGIVGEASCCPPPVGAVGCGRVVGVGAVWPGAAGLLEQAERRNRAMPKIANRVTLRIGKHPHEVIVALRLTASVLSG
ncbi:MAG: hypothetical protein L0177_19910 [Chloroflexi bacterium]|nr:hypothetical protein [Chloroflexota bacterium]